MELSVFMIILEYILPDLYTASGIFIFKNCLVHNERLHFIVTIDIAKWRIPIGMY